MSESTIICSNVVSQDQGLFNRISANCNPGANKLIDRKANEVLETDKSLVHGLHVVKCQDDQTKLCAQLLKLTYLLNRLLFGLGFYYLEREQTEIGVALYDIIHESKEKTESN